MIRQGVITAVGPSRQFEVALESVAGCGNCASAGGCGVQMLPANQTPLQIKCTAAQLHSELVTGSRVSVKIAEPNSGWLKLVGLAYGLPTVGMIAGALVGYYLALFLALVDYAEVASALGFGLGLGGGLIAWDRFDKSSKSDSICKHQIDSGLIVGVKETSGVPV